jgi:hypothetical protein
VPPSSLTPSESVSSGIPFRSTSRATPSVLPPSFHFVGTPSVPLLLGAHSFSASFEPPSFIAPAEAPYPRTLNSLIAIRSPTYALTR